VSGSVARMGEVDCGVQEREKERERRR
jgi:hypothetical protein